LLCVPCADAVRGRRGRSPAKACQLLYVKAEGVAAALAAMRPSDDVNVGPGARRRVALAGRRRRERRGPGGGDRGCAPAGRAARAPGRAGRLRAPHVRRAPGAAPRAQGGRHRRTGRGRAPPGILVCLVHIPAAVRSAACSRRPPPPRSPPPRLHGWSGAATLKLCFRARLMLPCGAPQATATSGASCCTRRASMRSWPSTRGAARTPPPTAPSTSSSTASRRGRLPAAPARRCDRAAQCLAAPPPHAHVAHALALTRHRRCLATWRGRSSVTSRTLAGNGCILEEGARGPEVSGCSRAVTCVMT